MISSETSAGLENLTRLGQLRWLFLDLGDVDAEALTKLSRLTQIDNLAFGGKKGNEVSMVKLKGMRNLKVLQVYGSWFTDAGLVHITNMDNLVQFFISDQTSVTPEGLTQLQRKLPKLDIGVNGSGTVPKARTDLLRGAVSPVAFGTR